MCANDIDHAQVLYDRHSQHISNFCSGKFVSLEYFGH